MRAISPVIATLLLIIVAAVAGVAVYSYVTEFIARTTTQARAPAQITIEAAGNGMVVVRNIGDRQAHVIAVYVLDADGALIRSQSVDVTVDPGDIETIDGLNLSGGSIVKVVTDDGGSASYRLG